MSKASDRGDGDGGGEGEHRHPVPLYDTGSPPGSSPTDVEGMTRVTKVRGASPSLPVVSEQTGVGKVRPLTWKPSSP